MRINLKEHPWSKGSRVFLDGVDVSNDCFEADDERGYVLTFLTDENGRRLRHPSEDRFATQRLEGQVRIDLQQDSRHAR